MLGKPFTAQHSGSMGVMQSLAVCGVLVTTHSSPGKVRVADLGNLKPQTEKYPIGYGEFDVSSEKLWGPYVMIVKRDQTVIVEGTPTLRFFVRVAPGTTEAGAKLAIEKAWLFRMIVSLQNMPAWHTFFTSKEE